MQFTEFWDSLSQEIILLIIIIIILWLHKFGWNYNPIVLQMDVVTNNQPSFWHPLKCNRFSKYNYKYIIWPKFVMTLYTAAPQMVKWMTSLGFIMMTCELNWNWGESCADWETRTVVIVSAAATMSANPALMICSSRSFNMGSIPLGTLSISENIRCSSAPGGRKSALHTGQEAYCLHQNVQTSLHLQTYGLNRRVTVKSRRQTTVQIHSSLSLNWASSGLSAVAAGRKLPVTLSNMDQIV